ncbi:MAG TPA: tripartite tricarboxylate transporter substrate binding protein [Eoetvoesiella sp.]
MKARYFLIAAAYSLVSISSAWANDSADYPARAIKMVIPYAAGGGVDLLGRKFAEAFSKQLGQTVFVENKVGAGGTLGASYVAQSRPDGYTLLFGGSPLITNKLMNPSLSVDALTSFAPVALINMNPFVLTVANSSPYKKVEDLVQAAQKEPGKLNFASGGIGTGSHLAGAALATAGGIDVVHVPYRGSVELVPSLLSGQTQFCFPVVTAALPQFNAGAVRILAVTSSKRLPILPDTPTMKEALGNDDVVVESWNGIWGPLDLPADIAAKLNTAIHETFKQPELKEFFDKNGSPVELTETPADFTRFLQNETAKFGRIIKASNVVKY